MSGYERENRNVLRRCLKTASDGAAVTWAGRSFHTAAPEAVNVRLPTVDRYHILDAFLPSLPSKFFGCPSVQIHLSPSSYNIWSNWHHLCIPVSKPCQSIILNHQSDWFWSQQCA